MSKCKPKYKNLNRIQSFSDQKYAVVSWAEQNCQNDEWLRQQVEQLRYLSPPAVRKKFKLNDFIDENQSYGYVLTESNEAIFSNVTEKPVPIDFTDMSLIDEKSNCAFPTFEDDDGNIRYKAEVPKVTSSQEDFSTSHKHGNGANSYWYVGYDKNKPYVVKPHWMNNVKNANIPSIVRAQTFKVKMDSFSNDVQEGLLEAVTLLIQNTGEIAHNWTSPLYVQLWPTFKRFVPKTEWINRTQESTTKVINFDNLDKKSDATSSEIAAGQYKENYATYSRLSRVTNNKKTKFSDSNGNYYKVDKNGSFVVKREYIYWPKSKVGDKLSISKPLAEGIFNPDETSPGWYTIVFNKAAKVKRDGTYAIVVFSPLSHPTHCPRIGGWGRNCNKAKYNGGDAFLSEDNGRTFVRYGHNDEDNVTPYKYGKYAPQDFAFECRITQSNRSYDTESDYYLYLKPIFANPIKKFHLAGDVYGETNGNTSAADVNLTFEYSTDGRDWDPIRMGEEKYFLENHPNRLFIRAKMSTSNPGDSPDIENLCVYLTTDVSKQMYVRTKMYNPKLNPMLGASLWGRIYAPYELTPDSSKVSASVEIIQQDLRKEHFHIIEVSDLENYLSVQDSKENFILDESKIIGVDDDHRAKYLIDNPSVLKSLKECSNVYVKPYVYNDVEYLMSFDGGVDDEDNPILGGLNLSNSPAYPIQECMSKSDSDEPEVLFGEWFDFEVDYTNDIVYFDREVLDNMPIGGLYISYNPVFIQDLTLKEVGIREDEETGLIEEGLILDYFKESFIVDETNVRTRRIPLRVIPVDPIREVILNKDTDAEEELHEDIDFTVDYVNKELVFPILDDANQLSRLSINDTLDVVYTPNIEDTGIAIGYWCNRDDTNHQCRIKSNYIEYKV